MTAAEPAPESAPVPTLIDPATVAIIAGGGSLPGVLAAALPGALVCAPMGVATALPAERFHFERLVPFLDQLVDRGITTVVLGGAIQRPRLDPALFDAATAQLVPRLVAAMQGGDDATLRAMIAIIEEAGLQVRGAGVVVPDLLPGPGVLGAVRPGPADAVDVARAAMIVAALGAVDVGQGAVVAQGLCLAVEALPGTDVMLAQVARDAARLRPDPAGARGVLFKAPKPGQDWRVDLPAIGPDTVAGAAAAGLGGIAWQAGGVMVLDRAALVAAADAAGVFLWAWAPE